MVGFLTSEINPVTGIIAAYSTQSNIYIWPRLRDMFKEGHEGQRNQTPLKVIYGVTATLSTLPVVLVTWSPNGK